MLKDPFFIKRKLIFRFTKLLATSRLYLDSKFQEQTFEESTKLYEILQWRYLQRHINLSNKQSFLSITECFTKAVIHKKEHTHKESEASILDGILLRHWSICVKSTVSLSCSLSLKRTFVGKYNRGMADSSKPHSSFSNTNHLSLAIVVQLFYFKVDIFSLRADIEMHPPF